MPEINIEAEDPANHPNTVQTDRGLVIKIHGEVVENEPYVKLDLQPAAGFFGFSVKQKTWEEAEAITDKIITKYGRYFKNI